MGKNKFYGVKIGRKPGVYSTWGEAEAQIKGYSGANFKSFSTEEEALDYVTKDVDAESEAIKKLNERIDNEISELKDGEAIAFIDGSYGQDKGVNKYSFAAIIFTKGLTDQLYKSFNDELKLEHNNVSGEIEGAVQAISWAIENKMKRIKLFYDYEGIEKWANGEYQARNELTKKYVEFYNDKSSIIEISFEHVPAHSKIKYNEDVDKLAKSAISSETFKTYKDGTVKFLGLNKENWENIISNINNVEEASISYKSESKGNGIDKLNLNLCKFNAVIHCYPGIKSYLQGKSSTLTNLLVSYGLEYIKNDKEVVEVLNNYHSTNITQNDIESKLERLMPNLPVISDSKLRNTILSAVFNSLYNGYMPDYTCLVHPIIRLYEYYLHRILHDRLELSTDRNGKNNFAFFSLDNSNNSFYCNVTDMKDLSEIQIDYLNKLYNRYSKVRHPFSHWSQDTMDTAVVTSLDQAKDILKENLQFINNYYKIF